MGNLFQGTQSDYSLAKGTAGALQKGLQQIAEAGGNTFAFAEDAVLAPLELAFGRDLGEISDNAPLNRWAQKSPPIRYLPATQNWNESTLMAPSLPKKRTSCGDWSGCRDRLIQQTRVCAMI